MITVTRSYSNTMRPPQMLGGASLTI